MEGEGGEERGGGVGERPPCKEDTRRERRFHGHKAIAIHTLSDGHGAWRARDSCWPSVVSFLAARVYARGPNFLD